jgi:hypothetical protein
MTPAPSWEPFRYTVTEADTAVAVGIGEVRVLATPRVLEADALPDEEAAGGYRAGRGPSPSDF